MIISLIAAMDKNRVIGQNGRLPWRLPADMRRFVDLTLGKPVIMGRKTYDSLPPRFRPLPGRLNIVVTRNVDYKAPGAIVAHSVEEALSAAGEVEEIVIVGGADLFRRLMPVVNRLYLTQIHGTAEGDVFFPEYDHVRWREVYRQEHSTDERHPYAFTWLILDRIEKSTDRLVD